MKRAKSVEDFIRDASAWNPELERLREILLATDLTEEIKWGAPCYTHNGKNVVGIGAFKSYFGLWYHQRALLADDAGVLINAQQGKTRALRQWRMSSMKDIKAAIIKRYVKESVANVDSGRQIKAKRAQPIDVPQELHNALRRLKGATSAFHALRPGLQREYADYVASARRDDTKARRIEKILPMIVAGAGLNDRYR